MISLEEFKCSLLEFIEFRGEPFDADFIYRQCIQPIDRYHIYEALYQLELEGKILRLRDGRFIATNIALKRWLNRRVVDVKIPEELIAEAMEAMRLIPEAWESLDSFISDAIREYVERIRSLQTEKLRGYGRRRRGKSKSI